MINCLVIDDEPIARRGLIEYIRQIDFLCLVAECKTALEGISWLQRKRIDLIFLDIQMPKLTGIDFVKNNSYLPAVIFTTAYPEYAMEGYELDVLDYLLKPISFQRFLKASLKAQEYIHGRTKTGQLGNLDYFFIKTSQKIEKIMMADLLYVEALSNYVILHTRQKKHIVYITFKATEEQLPSQLFIRVHKSFIVSVNAIKSINGNDIIIENGSLPIGKTYKEEVMARIEGLLFRRK